MDEHNTQTGKGANTRLRPCAVGGAKDSPHVNLLPNHWAQHPLRETLICVCVCVYARVLGGVVGATPGCAQGFILALNSGLTPGRLRGHRMGFWGSNQVS